MYFSALLDPIYLCLNGLNKSSRASVHACAITQLLPSTAPGSLIGQEPRTSGFPAKVIHSVHLWGRGGPLLLQLFVIYHPRAARSCTAASGIYTRIHKQTCPSPSP